MGFFFTIRAAYGGSTPTAEMDVLLASRMYHHANTDLHGPENALVHYCILSAKLLN